MESGLVKVEAVEENKSCLTATLLASDLRLAAALPTCFARRDRSHNIRTDEGEQQIERFLGNKLPWISFLDECQLLNLSSVCQEIASCDGHKIFSSFLNPRPYKGENTLFFNHSVENDPFIRRVLQSERDQKWTETTLGFQNEVCSSIMTLQGAGLAAHLIISVLLRIL